jgi:mannose-6-phosphate isomerase-like protein (cupin superfamily)
MTKGDTPTRDPVILAPGEGRSYPMGRLSAVFKADGQETQRAYSISEWWLDPHTKGPHAHSHPDDDVFYVLAGTLSVLVGTEWIEAPAGSFILVPGDVTHTFENRSGERAGFLNVSAPGSFEEMMPGIARWFIERSSRDSDTEEAERVSGGHDIEG